MEANDDKVNGVLSFAERLVREQHFASEKIAKKAEDIQDRRNSNHEMALAQLEKLRDQLLLHQFLQDCEEFSPRESLRQSWQRCVASPKQGICRKNRDCKGTPSKAGNGGVLTS